MTSQTCPVHRRLPRYHRSLPPPPTLALPASPGLAGSRCASSQAPLQWLDSLQSTLFFCNYESQLCSHRVWGGPVKMPSLTMTSSFWSLGWASSITVCFVLLLLSLAGGCVCMCCVLYCMLYTYLCFIYALSVVCVFVYICVICMWGCALKGVLMYVCVMYALECVYKGCAHMEDIGTGVCLCMWSVCMCDVCTGVCTCVKTTAGY